MLKMKGQGAMEYLMTYGWAILVVMLVGLALWRLGVFNLSGTSTTFSGFSGVKPLVSGCKVTTAGAFSCTFVNGEPSAITITSVNVFLNNTLTACTVLVSPTVSSVIKNGDPFTVSMTSCPTGNAGSSFKARVYIGYTNPLGGRIIAQNDTGIIQGAYEK